MTGRLTGSDERVIGQARELAGLHGSDAVSKHSGEADTTLAYADVLGEAQYYLRELARIIGLLAGEHGDDTRRLAEIRALLAGFDWEYHDRQLALEAIERIAEGGQA